MLVINRSLSLACRRSWTSLSSRVYIHSCVNQDNLNELNHSDSEYDQLADHYLHIRKAHKVLIIQPYVKWGPKKLSITPEEQLSEAVALIHTLPEWTVKETVTIPLDTLSRPSLFKSGSMERIKTLVQRRSDISAIFVNSGSLKNCTAQILQENFQRPVLDRYRVVMQILKANATSKQAKLQVALAELYYIKRKSETDLMFKASTPEAVKLLFQEREKKIKNQISVLRQQRNLLRSKREKLDYPIVAVVGYTNAGKTSVIKSLTGAENLKPKNQLFATLDVTVHEGKLPSGLEVLFVDTVGFISDIPTNLIECFVATLEDALLADVILHVEDISSKSYEYKRKHVLQTLDQLEKQSETGSLQSKLISVGNKCDLVDESQVEDKNIVLISAKSGTGLQKLRHQLEQFILHATDRETIKIRIPNGGEEMRWLHKNATVLEEVPDQNDLQYIFAEVVITQASLVYLYYPFKMATVPSTIVIKTEDPIELPIEAVLVIIAKQIFRYGVKLVKKEIKFLLNFPIPQDKTPCRGNLSNLPVKYIRLAIDTEEEWQILKKYMQKYTSDSVPIEYEAATSSLLSTAESAPSTSAAAAASSQMMIEASRQQQRKRKNEEEEAIRKRRKIKILENRALNSPLPSSSLTEIYDVDAESSMVENIAY